jgi:tetratricopeptide (TPR) repeat protein
MENNLEAQVWREKSAKLLASLKSANESGELTVAGLCDFISSASKSLFHNQPLSMPPANAKLGNCFSTLHHYLQLAISQEGGFVMIPLQVSLLRSGQLSIEELVEYLHESVLIALDIEDTDSPNKTRDDDSEIESEFNALLDDIENLADDENYKEAIRLIDKAFDIAEKEPLLFYDKCTLINNRGFYNYKLGNLAEALLDVDKAIEEDPDDDLPYYTRAEILYEMKDYNAALSAINKALVISADSDKEDFRKLILEKL